MHLVAVFESWHVPDGNYAPFDRGQRARLSFELDGSRLEPIPARPTRFASNDDATCEFDAVVLGKYGGLTVLEAGGFRFYVNGKEADLFDRGVHLRGSGTLALDHYAWFEEVDSFSDPPDLFYETTVTRIRKVRIPERFIHRHETGKSLPTTVGPRDYSSEDIEDLVTMNGQSFDEEFYLLDLDAPAVVGTG